MTAHAYSPEQALKVLIQKLIEKDKRLAEQIQAAINAGKDVTETEPPVDRRKKARVYRKTVPFTHEEALQIALDALQAYFVEQPLFVDSLADSFAKAAFRIPLQQNLFGQTGNDDPQPTSIEGEGVGKAVVIELQTETQLSRTGEATTPLTRIPKEQIEVQRHQIAALRELIKFHEDETWPRSKT